MLTAFFAADVPPFISRRVQLFVHLIHVVLQVFKAVKILGAYVYELIGGINGKCSLKGLPFMPKASSQPFNRVTGFFVN